MRRSPRFVALLSGLIGTIGVVHAASRQDSASAVQAVRSCATEVTAEPALRGAQLLARCPQLDGALTALGVAAQLDPRWRETMTTTAVTELADLTERYTARAPSSAPRVAPLHDIVRQLPQTATPQSWWERFKQRLLAWLHARNANNNNSWLDRWLSGFHPSARALRWSIDGVVLALIGAALWVVWRELRVAQVWRRRRAFDPLAPLNSPLLASGEINLENVERAAPVEQPALMLRLLVQVMRATGRLRADRSLTHRELVLRSRLEEATQRERLSRLSLLAERRLYGPPVEQSAQGAEGVQEVVSGARELYLHLQRESALTP